MYKQLFHWCTWLLRTYLKPSRLEEIEGDLMELYELRSIKRGTGSATMRFLWDVIRFFKPRYIREWEDIRYLNSLTMIRNYLKIAARNSWRHKFFTGINVMGLSIGITCCFLILLFIKHELSYDQFFDKHEQIMRVSLNGYGATPAPFASTALQSYPEIENSLRIRPYGEVTFAFKDKVFAVDGGLSADSTFFEVFDWPLIEGNPKTALKDPQSIVLTKSMVLQFFNRMDVVGELIEVDGQTRKVTGITEDFPDNSHIAFRFILPYPVENWVTNGSWTGNNFYTYLKLYDTADKAALEEKFHDMVRVHMAEEIISYTGHESYDDYLADKSARKYNFYLFPIADLHLHHKWMSMTTEANVQNIYTFSIIALFVLLIACINFMNLSTARSATRSKEVGVRKVLGSPKSHLTLQFLTESLLITGLAIVLTLVFTLSLLPHFNELSGKSFSLTDVLIPSNLLLLAGIGIVTGLLAGLYPALYLSGIQPVAALKGLFRLSGHSFLRKGLVTFQFAVSILLIICTVIVYSQVHYMNTKDLGIDTEHTIVVSRADKLGRNLNVVKQSLLGLSDVNAVSLTNALPAQWVPNWTYQTDEPAKREFNPDHVFVSETYDDVLGVEMLSGSFFAGKVSDTASIVVNEALIRRLDWQLEDAVGKKLLRPDEGSYEIIGVMKDFHVSSFRESLRPMLLRYSEYLERNEFGRLYMMINVSGNYPQVLDELQRNWTQYAGTEILSFEFLDQKFDSLYADERNFGKIFSTFSVLAI
ncbi:MAG: ABC transporter permease, partial [Bacteroidota bacterium]